MQTTIKKIIIKTKYLILYRVLYNFLSNQNVPLKKSNQNIYRSKTFKVFQFFFKEILC